MEEKTSNTSSILQPNAYDILNTYFIKSILHVSVCYNIIFRGNIVLLVQNLYSTNQDTGTAQEHDVGSSLAPCGPQS